MKQLSRWARQHKYLAIALLIGCEVANAFNGLLLGANALDNWTSNALVLSMLALLGVGVWVRWWAMRHPPNTYAASRWQMVAAFGSTYLLFVFLGAQWGQSVTQPTGYRAAYGSRQVVMRSDTLIQPGKSTAGVSGTAVPPNATPEGGKQTGRLIAYILLFLAGIGLMVLSVGLACNIACAGSGFLALIVLVLGLGAGAGGVFFAGWAADKPIRRWRDIPKPERPKMTRRFWRAWLILIAIVGAILLLGAVS